MSKTLYVGNLNYNTTNQDLESFFADQGEVVSAKIIVDRDNNDRSKGFGFVEMSSEEEAQTAVTSLNGASFMQREIKVNIAQDRKPRN